MNAALILSGGRGARFGSGLPKQYHKIAGKSVIEYALIAAESAKSIGMIVIAAKPCAEIERLGRLHEFVLADAGETRNATIKNGLDALAMLDCENVIILDAVRPLVTGELIDEYMRFLSEGFDAVSTAQKITDSLGCYTKKAVNRDDYYLMQSPEAYKFKMLHENFDCESPLTEVAQQLPDGAKVKLYFDFKDNIKLTYRWEKAYLAQALKGKGIK